MRGLSPQFEADGAMGAVTEWRVVLQHADADEFRGSGDALRDDVGRAP